VQGGTAGTTTGVYYPSTNQVAISTASTQAVLVDASQNVGIGTSSPATKLQVNGSIALASSNNLSWGGAYGAGIPTIAASSAGILFYPTGSTLGESARIDSSGNLLVGVTSSTQSTFAKSNAAGYVTTFSNSSTTSPYNLQLAFPNSTGGGGAYFIVCQDNANRFLLAGNGNCTNVNGSYGAFSDIKLKENIVDATPKLTDLMQVKIRNYNLIGETTKQIGVVAQELEQVFPSMVEELVDKDADNNDLGTTTKSVKYSVFVPMLIKAIQEQQALITQLTDRIAALEAK
jgi:hypothetical protein